MAYISKETVSMIRKEIKQVNKKYKAKTLLKNLNNMVLQVKVMAGKMDFFADVNVTPDYDSKISYELVKRFGAGLSKDEVFQKIDELKGELYHGDLGFKEKTDIFWGYNSYAELYNGFYDDIFHQYQRFFKKNSTSYKYFKELEDFIKDSTKWYDRSDVQNDYFDTSFYIEFRIGNKATNKPYVTI